MLLPHTYAYIVPYFAIHPPMSGYSRSFLPTFMTIQACSLMVAEEVDAIVFRFACGILLALELEVVGADA